MTDRPSRRVAVIDIGKTNAKVVVVETESGTEIALRKTTNTVLTSGPYPHFDTDALWAFILDTLKEFAATPGFDALSITTHGACAALLDAQGDLALPVLDYEHGYSENINTAYDAIRPRFEETFSPRLTSGLNLGAQLHFQSVAFPQEFARVAQILTYPQYWTFRLTGVAANEITSLGCHTDLWSPFKGRYSSLVDSMQIRNKLAPIRSAFDVLGVVKPEIAGRLGLMREIPVYCGIHDSNASLLPHLIGFGSPCTVVSTGTWVICFGVGAKPQVLNKDRDTLVNVDAHGSAVPSARYMGGREWDLSIGGVPQPSLHEELSALASVINRRLMLLPSVVGGCGPFPSLTSRWSAEPEDDVERRVAASLYQSMMTATCLDIIASSGPIVVEGPFAANEIFLRGLHTLADRPVYASKANTGTALGAALLTGAKLETPMREVVEKLDGIEGYLQVWKRMIEETASTA